MPLPYEFELDDSRLSLLEKIKPGDVCAEIDHSTDRRKNGFG